jgi:lysophospholipase L1-like esterase
MTPVQPASYQNLARGAIAAEIAARVQAFAGAAPARPQPCAPLNLLGLGDSWFDYPLDGPLFAQRNDVLAQLPSVCAVTPRVLSLAHYGYTSTQEMGLAKQRQLTTALRSTAFDAILFSAGGNDVAGDALVLWLNDAEDVRYEPAAALNAPRFDGALAVVRAAYLDLIALRDEYAPAAHVFAHTYDFPPVTGIGVCNLGPWLKPALAFCGWTDATQCDAIVRDLMLRFHAMVAAIAAQPENRLTLVQTQGTLTGAGYWANELHPTPAGFRQIAQRFAAALAAQFPGRV